MIYIDGNKTLMFYPNMLTKKKRKAIDALADEILEVKNMLAVYISLNIDFFIENIKTKYDFFAYCSETYKNKINLPSQVYTETLEDTYDAHLNRFDSIRKRMCNVTLTHIKKFEYYKVNRPKDFIFKGGVKSVTYTHDKSDLTIFLGTMTMFYEKDNCSVKQQMIDYTEHNLESLHNEQEELLNKKYEGIEDIQKEIKKDKSKLKKIEKSIKHFENFKKYLSDGKIFERVYNLSRQRRKRILDYYRTNPIEFKSKSFRGRSKVKIFVQENKNSQNSFKDKKHHSIINAYLDLGAVCSKYGYTQHLYIPIKHSKDYHGDLDSFIKSYESNTCPNYQYHVVYDLNGRIHFTTPKKCSWSYPEIKDDMSVIGSDLNMKHNMEQLSDGSYIDWPRKLLDELVEIELKKDKFVGQRDELKKIIEIKKRNASETGSVCDTKAEEIRIKDLNNSINIETRKEKAKVVSIKHDVFREISKMLNHLIEAYDGNVQLALEDIDGKFKSNKRLKYKTKDGNEINQTRLFKLCHFGEIKDIIKRMASKSRYMIPVSFVPSYYSSQICPECGYIDRNNRKKQEELKCVNCGCEYPADLKSSRILATYLSAAVLCESLLTQDETGAYVPKKGMGKEKTKQILQKYSRDIVQTFKKNFLDI